MPPNTSYKVQGNFVSFWTSLQAAPSLGWSRTPHFSRLCSSSSVSLQTGPQPLSLCIISSVYTDLIHQGLPTPHLQPHVLTGSFLDTPLLSRSRGPQTLNVRHGTHPQPPALPVPLQGQFFAASGPRVS